MKSARELEANVKPLVSAMPMLEMFVPYPTVTMVRFGKWDEILKAPKPEANLKVTTAIWNFSRGMAYAASKDHVNAQKELEAFKAITKDVPPTNPWGNNVIGDVLRAAETALTAKIALAKGDKTAAYALFAKAVEADDAVQYNEPADWDIPVREIYGAVLLMNGDNAEAEKVFRAEITKHQRNGRALFGLAESLKRQGKTSSAMMVQKEFEIAWANAEVKLTVAELAGIKE
jgi:tetratricopeptide (TPR) repeat protein